MDRVKYLSYGTNAFSRLQEKVQQSASRFDHHFHRSLAAGDIDAFGDR